MYDDLAMGYGTRSTGIGFKIFDSILDRFTVTRPLPYSFIRQWSVRPLSTKFWECEVKYQRFISGHMDNFNTLDYL